MDSIRAPEKSSAVYCCCDAFNSYRLPELFAGIGRGDDADAVPVFTGGQPAASLGGWGGPIPP